MSAVDDANKQEENTEKEKKGEVRELISAVIVAAIIALTVRSFAYEPFNIPSGSMLPTLQIGDYLFVSKSSYGYSQYSFPFGVADFDGRIMGKTPKRGDIAVFRKPHQTNIDYIKRIIGLPGDEIQVVEGILHINGDPVIRERVGTVELVSDNKFAIYTEYLETLPNGVKHTIYEISDYESLDDTEVFTVPEAHYFAMGDNRDRSLDSRVSETVGFIPAENLIGRASFFFFSTEGVGDKCDYDDGTFEPILELGCKIIIWPQAIRYSRILRAVK